MQPQQLVCRTKGTPPPFPAISLLAFHSRGAPMLLTRNSGLQIGVAVNNYMEVVAGASDPPPPQLIQRGSDVHA